MFSTAPAGSYPLVPTRVAEVKSGDQEGDGRPGYPEEEQATQTHELSGTTVSRCGHLRSAPVVVNVGLRTEWEPPTRLAWAPPTWLTASAATNVTDRLLSSSRFRTLRRVLFCVNVCVVERFLMVP